MEMLADSRGITITDADKADLKLAFSSMPPHPEVPAALARLQSVGFRLFTLTDNLLEVQEHQLTVGGIIGHYERRFSVDQSVKRHKPALEAYRYVEERLGAAPGDMLLIASHLWDTMGAQAAGWRAAFITRAGNAPLAVGPQPNFIGTTLAEIADQLISTYP
jgi:2-haloacid dehalogenase